MTTKSSKGSRCLFEVSALDVVTWGIWESEETSSKNDSPSKLNGDWDTVLSGVVDVLCDVDEDRGEEDTDGNAELVTCDQGTTNSLWSLQKELACENCRERDRRTYNLGHVEDDNGRFETDSDTSNQTTNDDCSESITSTSDHLNNDTDHVDQTSENDSPFATNAIRDITSDDSTEESTSGQDRDDEGGVGGTESDLLIDDLLVWAVLDVGDEERRWQDTVDVTGIITKEDTSERCKSANQVGLEGDWSLNTGNVVAASRHCCCLLMFVVVDDVVYGRERILDSSLTLLLTEG